MTEEMLFIGGSKDGDREFVSEGMPEYICPVKNKEEIAVAGFEVEHYNRGSIHSENEFFYFFKPAAWTYAQAIDVLFAGYKGVKR